MIPCFLVQVFHIHSMKSNRFNIGPFCSHFNAMLFCVLRTKLKKFNLICKIYKYKNRAKNMKLLHETCSFVIKFGHEPTRKLFKELKDYKNV